MLQRMYTMEAKSCVLANTVAIPRANIQAQVPQPASHALQRALLGSTCQVTASHMLYMSAVRCSKADACMQEPALQRQHQCAWPASKSMASNSFSVTERDGILTLGQGDTSSDGVLGRASCAQVHVVPVAISPVRQR